MLRIRTPSGRRRCASASHARRRLDQGDLRSAHARACVTIARAASAGRQPRPPGPRRRSSRAKAAARPSRTQPGRGCGRGPLPGVRIPRAPARCSMQQCRAAGAARTAPPRACGKTSATTFSTPDALRCAPCTGAKERRRVRRPRAPAVPAPDPRCGKPEIPSSGRSPEQQRERQTSFQRAQPPQPQAYPRRIAAQRSRPGPRPVRRTTAIATGDRRARLACTCHPGNSLRRGERARQSCGRDGASDFHGETPGAGWVWRVTARFQYLRAERPQGDWHSWLTWISRSKREASSRFTNPRSANGCRSSGSSTSPSAPARECRSAASPAIRPRLRPASGSTP